MEIDDNKSDSYYLEKNENILKLFIGGINYISTKSKFLILNFS